MCMEGVCMERRTFVQGAFGLMVLAVGGGIGARLATQAVRDEHFVTPEVTSPEVADGPAMAAGIQLVPNDDGTVRGEAQGVHLFNVDQMGAQLMRLADGTRSIDDLAASLDEPALPADVASFFVTLGQAGYLANTVLVNLVEIPT